MESSFQQKGSDHLIIIENLPSLAPEDAKKITPASAKPDGVLLDIPDYLANDIASGILGKLNYSVKNQHAILRHAGTSHQERAPRGHAWHRDASAVTLFSGVVNDVEAPTLFLNIEAVKNALPESMRSKIDFTDRGNQQKNSAKLNMMHLSLLERGLVDSTAIASKVNMRPDEVEEIFEVWKAAIKNHIFEYVIEPGTMVCWPNSGKIYHRSHSSGKIVENGMLSRIMVYSGGDIK